MKSYPHILYIIVYYFVYKNASKLASFSISHGNISSFITFFAGKIVENYRNSMKKSGAKKGRPTCYKLSDKFVEVAVAVAH